MDSPRLSVHTLSLSGPSSLVFISFVPSLGPLTCLVGFVATYLLGCFIEAMLAAYMSGWWQCISSLPTMLWHFAAFGASANSLSTTSIGGLCVRMVAVLQLTTAHNASTTYLLRCSFQQRQALVAYLSGWWQCFGSLLPTMLWRPTYFGASTNSLSTTSIGGLCVRMVAVLQLTTANNDLPTSVLIFSKGKRWWPMCQDGGNASAHYCQQCFGDLPTSVLPLTLSAKASVGGLYVSGWWQRFGSLLPTMLWRPTYCGVSAYSFSKGKRWLSTRQKSGSASAHTGTPLCLKNMARNKRLEPAQESAQSWMSVLRKPLKTDKPRGFTFSWAARLVFFLLFRWRKILYSIRFLAFG